MRVTAAFNRLLGFAGTMVESVSFSGHQIVVGVRLRSRMLVCPCGRVSRARYDMSRRRWRHVDLGRFTVVVEADIRRVDCGGCGQVRTEWMPWTRPGARHTRDFEDMIGWLAQRMSKSGIATLMRSTWETVNAVVVRLVGHHLDHDRLDGLYRIGVDEIAYRRGRKFLTVVADHDTGNVVWIGEGRTMAALDAFYAALGADRRAQIETVTMDMSQIYRNATQATIPHARICYDPFHVIMWAGDAIEQAYRATPPLTPPLELTDTPPGKTWAKVRSTLRAAAENLTPDGRAIIKQLRQRQQRLHHAWELKEQLRDLYRTVNPDHAATYLEHWCHQAETSAINAFVTLARRIRRNFDGITAAVELNTNNSLVEGINAGIRLIQRRAHGYANLDNLITMIYLCHGGTPTRRP